MPTDQLTTAISRLLATDAPRILVAIDGRCASGKTTLARALAEQYGANLFHTDDFFLPPKKRTAERLATPGGNMDRERFEEELLIPLQTGLPFSYRPWNCNKGDFDPPVQVFPKRLNLIEGAYSCHPEIVSYYDFCVFSDISPALQKERILARNGENGYLTFHNKWIPMEEVYLRTFDIQNKCDIKIKS